MSIFLRREAELALNTGKGCGTNIKHCYSNMLFCGKGSLYILLLLQLVSVFTST
jgi:hypothetical protein